MNDSRTPFNVLWVHMLYCSWMLSSRKYSILWIWAV